MVGISCGIMPGISNHPLRRIKAHKLMHSKYYFSIFSPLASQLMWRTCYFTNCSLHTPQLLQSQGQNIHRYGTLRNVDNICGTTCRQSINGTTSFYAVFAHTSQTSHLQQPCILEMQNCSTLEVMHKRESPNKQGNIVADNYCWQQCYVQI